jgi:O-antigen ligase
VINKILVLLVLSAFFARFSFIPISSQGFELLIAIPVALLLILNLKFISKSSLVIAFLLFIIFINFLDFEHYRSAYAFQGFIVSVFIWSLSQKKWSDKSQKVVSIWIFVISIVSLFKYFGLFPYFLGVLNDSGAMYKGVFLQENAQMLFMIIAFYFLLSQCLKRKKNENWFRFNVLQVVLLVVQMYLASGAKTGLVSLFVSLTVMLLLYFLPKIKISKNISLMALIGITISFCCAATVFVSQSDIPTIVGRWQIWKAAFEMGSSHLFGVGLGEFSYHWPYFLEKNQVASVMGRHIDPESAHNIFLSAYAELGVFGLLTFSIIIFLPYFKLWLEVLEKRKIENIIWFAALTSLIIMVSMTTVVWTQPLIRFVFWFVIGLSWYNWGITLRVKAVEKYSKLIVIILIGALSFSSYQYSRFLYSEILIYTDQERPSFSKIVKILEIYPWSGAPQVALTDIYINNGEFDKASQRISLLKSISGDLFNPALLELNLAKKSGQSNLKLDVLEKYYLKYPKQSLDWNIELFEELKRRNLCKPLAGYLTQTQNDFLDYELSSLACVGHEN